MCGCSLNRGPKSILRDKGFTNILSEKDFQSGETNTLLQFWYCVDPVQFNGVLSKVKVDKGNVLRVDNNSDVKNLATIIDKKVDVEKLGVNLKEELSKMTFTPDQLKKTECTLAFATDI